MLIAFLVPVAYWLRFDAPMNAHWRDSSGGAAYVLFWSAALLMVCPRLSPARSVVGVLVVTCCLEFLQLWHPTWLEAIRRTLAGRLVLGTTFDWSDFSAYFAGALLSFVLLPLLGLFTRIKRRGSAI